MQLRAWQFTVYRRQSTCPDHYAQRAIQVTIQALKKKKSKENTPPPLSNGFVVLFFHSAMLYMVCQQHKGETHARRLSHL